MHGICSGFFFGYSSGISKPTIPHLHVPYWISQRHFTIMKCLRETLEKRLILAHCFGCSIPSSSWPVIWGLWSSGYQDGSIRECVAKLLTFINNKKARRNEGPKLSSKYTPSVPPGFTSHRPIVPRWGQTFHPWPLASLILLQALSYLGSLQSIYPRAILPMLDSKPDRFPFASLLTFSSFWPKETFRMSNQVLFCSAEVFWWLSEACTKKPKFSV